VKDFMNDFATDDFINKNIRVRPISGMTKGGEEEGHVFQAKSMYLGGGVD